MDDCLILPNEERIKQVQSWEHNEEIQIFREYLRFPTVHPNINYRKSSRLEIPSRLTYPRGPIDYFYVPLRSVVLFHLCTPLPSAKNSEPKRKSGNPLVDRAFLDRCPLVSCLLLFIVYQQVVKSNTIFFF